MKVQELLKVPSPENRLMLLQLGMNETARSLVVEALSHAENYPLILKCLGAAHDFVGSLSAPVAVEKELVIQCSMLLQQYGVLHSTTRVFSRVLGTLASLLKTMSR